MYNVMKSVTNLNQLWVIFKCNQVGGRSDRNCWLKTDYKSMVTVIILCLIVVVLCRCFVIIVHFFVVVCTFCGCLVTLYGHFMH